MGLINFCNFERASSFPLILRRNIWFKKHIIFKNKAAKRRWYDRKKLKIHKWNYGTILKNGFKQRKSRKNILVAFIALKKRWLNLASYNWKYTIRRLGAKCEYWLIEKK